MSTRENIRLIARAPLIILMNLYSTVGLPVVGDCGISSSYTLTFSVSFDYYNTAGRG